MQTDQGFASRTWKDLETAIDQIFERNAGHLSFESLYRSAYNMVLHKHGDMLHKNVTAAVQKHLDSTAAFIASRDDDKVFLDTLISKWNDHKVAMQMIRDILLYMDRTFIEAREHLPIYDMGMVLFQGTVIRHAQIKDRLLGMLLGFVERERQGDVIDRGVCKSVTSMFVDISIELYTTGTSPIR
eukprot:SAG31_NODE_8268_length_1485_cov_1.057720_1_plen_185_part_00